LDWISLYAIAVNEENAAGGRVVTGTTFKLFFRVTCSLSNSKSISIAPTNGSAGVLPAVLKYYLDFVCPSPAHVEQDVVEFLLTASAIGMLYKRGARYFSQFIV
jgi:L-serine deaminase